MKGIIIESIFAFRLCLIVYSKLEFQILHKYFCVFFLKFQTPLTILKHCCRLFEHCCKWYSTVPCKKTWIFGHLWSKMGSIQIEIKYLKSAARILIFWVQIESGPKKWDKLKIQWIRHKYDKNNFMIYWLRTDNEL